MTLEEMIAEEQMRRMVMGVSNPPAPVGRNLLEPHIPGTKAWTAGINAWSNDINPWSSGNLSGLGGFMALPIAYHGNPIWADDLLMGPPGVPVSELAPRLSKGKPFHAGTRESAMDRMYDIMQGRPPRDKLGRIYKVDIQPKKEYLPGGKILDERVNPDITELFYLNALKGERDKLLKQGYDVVPYINAIEGRGTKSYMVLDPKAVKFLEVEDMVPVGGWKRGPKEGVYSPAADPNNWGKTVPLGKGVKKGKPIKGKLGQGYPAGG